MAKAKKTKDGSEAAKGDTIKTGDKVTIHYTGRFPDGEVFDSSVGKAPLEFVAGKGMVIKGLDDEITSMKKGDKKTITIPPEKAYGNQNDNLLVEVPRDKFPPKLDMQKGMRIHLKGPNEVPIIATVMNSTEKAVTLDLNHPLAGKTLQFDIEVVDVKE